MSSQTQPSGSAQKRLSVAEPNRNEILEQVTVEQEFVGRLEDQVGINTDDISVEAGVRFNWDHPARPNKPSYITIQTRFTMRDIIILIMILGALSALLKVLIH